MKMPRRPRKSRLKKAMKNSREDGKDSEMPLYKGLRKPRLGYI